MTRRQFLTSPAALLPAAAGASPPRLAIPVHRVVDQRARLAPADLQRFSAAIWDQAAQGMFRCGIDLSLTTSNGEVKLYPSGRPQFVGLAQDKLNVVLTSTLPQDWDAGRALAGISTVYEGHHVCVIALHYAHGHRIPFLAVNTVLHELLHFLLLDVFVARPGMLRARWREERVDWHATRIWLFGGDAQVRQSAAQYARTLSARHSSPPNFPRPGHTQLAR